jgi:hypothetical protein
MCGPAAGSNLVSLEVFSAAPIPEPQTYALFLLGLGAIAGIKRLHSL